MVFSCSGCQARYRIDDRLLEERALRFSCRKCGQVHLLRGPSQGGPSVTPVGPGEASSPGTEGSRESRAPRPTLSMPTLPAAPAAPAATVPVPPRPAVPRPTTSTRSLPPVPAREAAPPRPAAESWFAIRQGQRLGPFTREGLLEQLRQGVLHDRSFVWRPTMASWVRLHLVADLAEVLAAWQAEEKARVEAGQAPAPREPSRSGEVPLPPTPAAASPATPTHAATAAPAPASQAAVPRPPLPAAPKAAPRPPVTPPAADSAPSPRSPGPAPAPDSAATPRRPAEAPAGDLPPPLPGPPRPLGSGATRPAPGPGAAPAAGEDLPPPLPGSRASAPAVPPPPSHRPDTTPLSPARRAAPPAPPRAPTPAPSRADELFGELSRPTIDLRKAMEVQPEEPEQVPRQRRAAPAPRPAPPPVADSDEALFPDAFVAPEAAWPSHLHGDEDVARLRAAPSAATPEVHHDPHMGLRDFSVMVRHLGQRTRKRKMLAATAAGSAAVLLVSGLVSWLLLAEPAGDLEPLPGPGAVAEARYETPPPVAPRAPRELPRASILENPDGPARPAPAGGNGAPRPPSPAEPLVVSSGPAQAPAPPPPQMARIDDGTRQDYQRYGSLLGSAGSDRVDAPVADQAPKTLAQMPRSTLSPQVMNEFLEKKQKRFQACKAAMKNPPDAPVRVGLSFDVGSDGRVGNVQVVLKDGLRDGTVATCIRDVVLEWAFPAQAEATTYRTTLTVL